MNRPVKKVFRFIALVFVFVSISWLTSCGGGGTLPASSDPASSTGSGSTVNSGGSGSTVNSGGSGSTQVTDSNPIVYLTWDNPTTNADGSPLDLTTLEGYSVTYTADGGTSTTDKVLVSGGANTWESPSLNHGTYTFSVTVFDSTGASVDSKTFTMDL